MMTTDSHAGCSENSAGKFERRIRRRSMQRVLCL